MTEISFGKRWYPIVKIEEHPDSTERSWGAAQMLDQQGSPMLYVTYTERDGKTFRALVSRRVLR